jgi:hypothetical protein
MPNYYDSTWNPDCVSKTSFGILFRTVSRGIDSNGSNLVFVDNGRGGVGYTIYNDDRFYNPEWMITHAADVVNGGTNVPVYRLASKAEIEGRMDEDMGYFDRWDMYFSLFPDEYYSNYI